MDPHELQCFIKKASRICLAQILNVPEYVSDIMWHALRATDKGHKTSFSFKKRSKVALHQYRIRPAFLQQLMLSCENECTLSALCTKAHTRKFPVFRAMWHSEGHLAVLFYIFFHHKNVVFLCFMWCFGDLF